MPLSCAVGNRVMRHIAYSIAVFFVAAITAPGVKSEQRADANSGYGSESAIGIAAVSINSVKGTIETKTVSINTNDRVFRQEIIETESNSIIQFLFLDETILTIGPESKLILDEMVFDPNVTTGKVVMNAVKGLFTFVSGSLPSESYEIKTPTVSIAIRGTKFDLFVSRKGASTVILRRGAINVKNRAGGVTRRISKSGLATSVSTRRSDPTPPALPPPELERLFKPLSDPRELQGKSPEKTNVTREGVEEESSRQRKQALLELGVKDGSVTQGTVNFSEGSVDPLKIRPENGINRLDVPSTEPVTTSTDVNKMLRERPVDIDGLGGEVLGRKVPKSSGIPKKARKIPPIGAKKASAKAKKVSAVAKKASAEVRRAGDVAKRASASAKKAIKKVSAIAKKSMKKASESAKLSRKLIKQDPKKAIPY